jgi:hypothetical protein
MGFKTWRFHQQKCDVGAWPHSSHDRGVENAHVRDAQGHLGGGVSWPDCPTAHLFTKIEREGGDAEEAHEGVELSDAILEGGAAETPARNRI